MYIFITCVMYIYINVMYLWYLCLWMNVLLSSLPFYIIEINKSTLKKGLTVKSMYNYSYMGKSSGSWHKKIWVLRKNLVWVLIHVISGLLIQTLRGADTKPPGCWYKTTGVLLQKLPGSYAGGKWNTAILMYDRRAREGIGQIYETIQDLFSFKLQNFY